VSERRIVHSCPLTLNLPRRALVPWPYGELLNHARTPLAVFFRILLDRIARIDEASASETTYRTERAGQSYDCPALLKCLSNVLFEWSLGDMVTDDYLTVRTGRALQQDDGDQRLRSRMGLVRLLSRDKDVHRHIP
jgi:hypothetical protein